MASKRSKFKRPGVAGKYLKFRPAHFIPSLEERLLEEVTGPITEHEIKSKRINPIFADKIRRNYVDDEKLRMPEHFCQVAALHGDIEMLQWGLDADNVCPLSHMVTMVAAENGHFEFLRYVREAVEPPCPWDEWCCAAAASVGHLEMLQYCRDEGCPWDRWTTAYAAKKVSGSSHPCSCTASCPAHDVRMSLIRYCLWVFVSSLPHPLAITLTCCRV